jgi:hypothetical protein
MLQKVLVQRHAATAFGYAEHRASGATPLLATLKIALFMVNAHIPTVMPSMPALVSSTILKKQTTNFRPAGKYE